MQTNPYFVKDITPIRPLIHEFLKEFAPEKADEALTKLSYNLETSHAIPSNTIIASSDNKAFLWASIIRGIILDDRVAYVNIIFVAPEVRRKGYAKDLLSKLKVFCEVYDVPRIIFHGTTPASREFVRKLGHTLEAEQYIINV